MPERNPSKKEIAARTATFAVGAAIAILGTMATFSSSNEGPRVAYGILGLWGTALALVSLSRGASWEFYNMYRPAQSLPQVENNQPREKDRATSAS